MAYRDSTAEKTTITRDLDSLSQPANGNIYESIVVFSKRANQINTELKKPFSEGPFFLNLFSSVNGRLEFNSHLNNKISDKIFHGIYIHGNKRNKKTDSNNDNFLDLPISQKINILNINI